MSYRMLTRTKGVELENWIKDNLRRIETEMSKPVGGVGQVVSFQPARPTPGGSPTLHAPTHADGGSDQVTISLPQIQNISSGVLLGRSSLLVGQAQEITLGHGLGMGEGIISVNDAEIVIDMSQVNGLVDGLSDKVSKSTATAQTITSAVTIEASATLKHAGTTRIETTTTGAKVTGVTDSGIARIGAWSNNSAFARFGHNSNDSATNYGFLQLSSSECYISGSAIEMQIGGSTKLKVDSTGAKVTGNLEVGKLSLQGRTDLPTTIGAIYGSDVATKNATNYGFFATADGTYAGISGTTESIMSVGNVAKVTATSTGAKVTGNLEVTGYVQVGTSTKSQITGETLGMQLGENLKIYGNLGGQTVPTFDGNQIGWNQGSGTRDFDFITSVSSGAFASSFRWLRNVSGTITEWMSLSSTRLNIQGNLEVTGSEIYTIPSATSGTINCAGKSVISIDNASTLGTGTTGQVIHVISSGSHTLTYYYASGVSAGYATALNRGASFLCVDGSNGYWKQV